MDAKAMAELKRLRREIAEHNKGIVESKVSEIRREAKNAHIERMKGLLPGAGGIDVEVLHARNVRMGRVENPTVFKKKEDEGEGSGPLR